MLDGVLRNPPLLIEFKDENAAELLSLTVMSVSVPSAGNEVLDLVHWILCSDSNTSIYSACSIAVFGFAARLPFHNELLLPVCVWYRAAAVAHHAFRQDRELHVADERHAAPGYWCCP